MNKATPADLRRFFRSRFEQGETPVDPRQPVADALAADMVQQLKDMGIAKDARIGILDAFLILAITLKENGYTNLTLLETEHPESGLSDKQKTYYNVIKKTCANAGVEYYTPPSNNYNRCEMSFDVIIGNPPYQDSSHGAKKNSMWKQFIDIAWERSDVVSFIVPASFTSPAQRFEEVKPYLKFVSFNVKQHFKGIGVQFCRFVLDRHHVGPCTIETHEGETFELDLSDQVGIPETITPQLIEDAKSIFLNTRKWEKTCEYHTQVKHKFNETGDIEVIHGAKVLRTDSDHPNNSKIRVQCPTTKHPVFTVVQNQGLSQTHIWTEVSSVEEGEELCAWLNSDEVQSVLRRYKWANMYYPQTIKQLG